MRRVASPDRGQVAARSGRHRADRHSPGVKVLRPEPRGKAANGPVMVEGGAL